MRGFVVLVALLCAAHGHPADHKAHGYRFNGPLEFECSRGPNHTFSKAFAPQCVDSNKPLSFKYGIDSMSMCLMSFSASDVEWLIELIQQKKTWNCRALMTPGHDVWIPFSIPIWGVVEGTHIHVDNHLNFVFHAWQGSLLAVAAYPLRDQFAYIDRKGGSLSIHGHVKFFQGESFNPLNVNAFVPHDPHRVKETISMIYTVIVWSLLSFFVTLIAAMLCFFFKLKPDIIEKEKGKQD